MYLWPFIDSLWVLLSIPCTNYEHKHGWKLMVKINGSRMEINGQNSDDQAEDVSDDFIVVDTYWVIPCECLIY